MSRGKGICKRLKEVRREIARANDIEFVTSECKFKGECTGTCPKCEAEVRYLEEQLSLRHRAGKAVAVAGIAASMFLCYAPASQAASTENTVECNEQPTQRQPSIKLTNTTLALGDSITVKGVIIDQEDGQPIIGASILLSDNPSVGVVSDLDGNFSIKVSRRSTLKIKFLAYTEATIEIPADQQTDIYAYISLAVDNNADLQGFIPSMVMHAIPKKLNHAIPKKLNTDYIVVESTTTDDPFDSVKIKGFIRGPQRETHIYLGNKCIAHDTGWNGFEFNVQRGATLIFKTPGYKDVEVKVNRKTTYINIDVFPKKL